MSELYNVKEVAARTGYVPATVRRLLHDGTIKGYQPGGRLKAEWRVTQEALDTFLNAKASAKNNRYRVEYDADGNFAITDTHLRGYVAMTEDFRNDIKMGGHINWGDRKQSYYSSKDLARLTEEAFVKAGAYAASLG